jgi:hypothetical protein
MITNYQNPVDSNFRNAIESDVFHWIPACAGMTKKDYFHAVYGIRLKSRRVGDLLENCPKMHQKNLSTDGGCTRDRQGWHYIFPQNHGKIFERILFLSFFP